MPFFIKYPAGSVKEDKQFDDDFGNNNYVLKVIYTLEGVLGP